MFASGIARTDWFQAIENGYGDAWHVIDGVRRIPSHTAVVTADDDTLLTLKDIPLSFWGPQFGLVMERLEQVGAKVIGLDFLYPVSVEEWLKKLDLADTQTARTYDAPLRAALARGNKVLIAYLVEQERGNLTLLLPSEDQLLLLPGGVNDLGIANLHPDDDKHVRRFYPVLLPDPTLPGLALGLQLALRSAGQNPRGPSWELGGQRVVRELRLQRIGYAGPPGTVPAVSMSALLQPGALSDPKVQALKGRVVIIGASNVGTPDRHFTPYSRSGRGEQMTGAEIHANIVETLLTGRFPRTLPAPAEVAYVFLLLIFMTAGFLRLSVMRGVMLALSSAIALAFVAYIGFRFDLLLPVAEPQLGVFIAFVGGVSFRLTSEERERARVRQIFGRYVSDAIVDRLLSVRHRPDLGGETATITVLFSDIRAFTRISEKLTAHEVVEMLNAYFPRVCDPVFAEDGTVDKYIGDAVMAVFGSPVPDKDHARRAIRAALGMANAAQGFQLWMRNRFPDRSLPEFAVGIGLHTGEAVIGDIGTLRRREFTAIGDTVNVASRLVGVTKDMRCTIVASEAVVRAAGLGVRTGKVEEVTVKGRSEPLRVHEVLGFEGAVR